MDELKERLTELTQIESEQLRLQQNVNSLHLNFVNGNVPEMPQSDFFAANDIVVTKNNRFSNVPAHTHAFVEMNYLYSGTCTQYINGEQITLHPQMLLLMDKSVTQQIDQTGANDILVNILIRDDSTINRLFEFVPQEFNDVAVFLANAAQVNTLHNNFMVFDLSHDEAAIKIMESLILKGMSKQDQGRFMTLLLSSLLMELSELIDVEFSNFARVANISVLPILEFIRRHISDVSLTSVSKEFGYNSNYLSNKLHHDTGFTFVEIVEKQRLNAAQSMMMNQKLSLNEIGQRVGYQNSSSLFRLFNKYTHMSPSEYRRKLGSEVTPSSTLGTKQ